MLQNFDNKVLVITGAGSGIGQALAKGFARQGMRVVATDINGEAAAATAADIGPQAVGRQVDVASAEQVQALADECFADFGQVDLLINNAGVFQGGLSWERSLEDWQWTFGVNVYGIIHGIKSFVPRMIAQGTDGHVVNTASVAAYVAGAMSAPYVVSKCTAMSLTECLALDLELMGTKIGASVLTPGNHNTGIAQTASLRPSALGQDNSEDGKACVEALQSMLDDGAEPEAAFQPVLQGVRSGEFLIPTKPGYQQQLRTRYEALLERKLPPMAELD